MPKPTNTISKKLTIERQALWNLGLEKKDILSETDLKLLEEELKGIVYVDGQLPNFIVSDSLEGNSSDELENPATALNDDEKYARNARNLLKHIVRGIPLCKTDGESYINSPLYADEIIETLTTKRDSRLLDSFRAEMQKVLNNSFEYLQSGKLSPDSEKQYEIFQSNFLAAYPFDISPKSGPFSWVLEDEDRIYAYALVSEQAWVVNHLLLMGSTYTAGQGRGFANLYNFKPRNSVGEGHDMTEVDAWLEQQKKNNRQVKVTGHSKGATMSMVTAARHPDVIIQADCLNPTGLCSDTLVRLTPAWDVLSQEQRPHINVYAQEGDPAFPLEKGFLEGTNIYRVLPNTDKAAMNFGPIATIQGVDISVPKMETQLLINGPGPYGDKIPRQLIYGSMIAGGVAIVAGTKAVNTGIKAATLLFSGIKNTAGWAVNQFNSASGDIDENFETTMAAGTKHLKMD